MALEKVQAYPGIPGGKLRLMEFPAALGALPQKGIGGGEVKRVRGESADLKQNGLLIGGEGGMKAFRGGGAALAFAAGFFLRFPEGFVFLCQGGDGFPVRGSKALIQRGSLG